MQKELIQYLKECYQSDHRGQFLWNIFAKENQYLRIISQESAADFFDKQSISIECSYGLKLQPAVSTYRREKNLVLCSHFIIGEISTNAYGKVAIRKICSPLIFTDLECGVHNEEYRLNGNPEMYSWNYPLLYQLVGEKSNADEVQDRFKQLNDPTDTNGLVGILNAFLGSSNITSIGESFTYKDEYKAIVKQYKTIPDFLLSEVSAVLLMDRSTSSMGIIDELELIAQSGCTSSLLSQFTSSKDVASHESAVDKTVIESDCGNVPGLLSEAQKSIIEKSSQNTLNLLIGPPGTGKSYTIASLVLERFMAGESVLVVSQNEHAVDVVRDKLIGQFGMSQNAVVRAGVKSYHRNLKQYLDQVLKGADVIPYSEGQSENLWNVRKRIAKAEKRLTRLLRKVRSDGELLYSVEAGAKYAGFVTKFRLWLGKFRNDRYDLLYAELAKLQDLNNEREAALSGYINNVFRKKIDKSLRIGRSDLVKLRKALGARTSQRQELLFSKLNLDVVLNAMPIWLCSLDALHKALPLKEELFDLVIIDEATQCDIASCLPALYRAKRALIVGDPKQLRHVSFLSRDRQSRYQKKYKLSEVGFSYRDHSMVDIASNKIDCQDSIVVLDEHYRSVPQIIKFSNDMFYESSLRIMTERPQFEAMTAVEVVEVDDGVRLDGVNVNEAKAVCNELRRIVMDQAAIPDDLKLSVGILSFFRAQAEHIQNEIFGTFTLDEITKHKIRAGTPYAFQGEERDIMLISCCVDSNSVGGTYTYLNRSDVFNVSITRAREKQVVFLSAARETLPAKSLLSKYIHSLDSIEKAYQPDFENRHAVVLEFTQILSGLGMTVLHDYPVAGIEMDLVLVHQGSVLAIDLIGFPGESGDPFHLERYKIFERAGLKILPISFVSWRLKRDAVIQLIEHSFTQLQEENSIQKLSVADFSHHWTKLLADNPSLASNVRSIEADLISLHEKEAISLLGALIDQYKKVIWVLNEKLNPAELTYARYSGSSEQVLLSGIDSLSQIVTIQKSMVTAQEPISPSRRALRSDKDGTLQTLFDELDKAIESLESLALKWSTTITSTAFGASDMDDALSDLENLIERVSNYE